MTTASRNVGAPVPTQSTRAYGGMARSHARQRAKSNARWQAVVQRSMNGLTKEQVADEHHPTSKPNFASVLH